MIYSRFSYGIRSTFNAPLNADEIPSRKTRLMYAKAIINRAAAVTARSINLSSDVLSRSPWQLLRPCQLALTAVDVFLLRSQPAIVGNDCAIAASGTRQTGKACSRLYCSPIAAADAATSFPATKRDFFISVLRTSVVNSDETAYMKYQLIRIGIR